MGYEIYDKLNFSVPISYTGDCYDRYLLRIEELRQSLAIILQVITEIPRGKVSIRNSKVVTPSRGELKSSMEALIHHFKLCSEGFSISRGEVYIGVEAPKGEFGVFLVADDSSTPYRCKIRAPGFTHLQGINYMAKGYLVADVVTIIGTLDLVLGEIDR